MARIEYSLDFFENNFLRRFDCGSCNYVCIIMKQNEMFLKSSLWKLKWHKYTLLWIDISTLRETISSDFKTQEFDHTFLVEIYTQYKKERKREKKNPKLFSGIVLSVVIMVEGFWDYSVGTVGSVKRAIIMVSPEVTFLTLKVDRWKSTTVNKKK